MRHLALTLLVLGSLPVAATDTWIDPELRNLFSAAAGRASPEP
jgi:hypothetical protein